MFQGRAIFCGTLACTAHRARASRRSSSAASRPGGHARLQSNGSGGPLGVYEIAGKSPRESVGDSEDAGTLDPSEEMQGILITSPRAAAAALRIITHPAQPAAPRATATGIRCHIAAAVVTASTAHGPNYTVTGPVACAHAMLAAIRCTDASAAARMQARCPGRVLCLAAQRGLQGIMLP